jgi:hypothetical protein
MSVANHVLRGKRWTYCYFDMYENSDLNHMPHESDFWVGFRLCMSF